ncbi:MAG: 2-hydroxyacyl-CoA dehydratase family protein [Dehalococcoidales bacterium]|jgi:benzoyl-CoA reductase/2-hydroxyglutaryl-CoA dehydratase subunit BcrC/BadD/HgdB|nr:2-hydroxyacyl-CoA dehydratase family protein [Dehalococcoidales bacterium]MDP6738151.1 2-hydroxyacyl-CoA dehydratase family protein [Dehalococcoidales bacterium]|tara:strand:+ start:2553 stop:3797 length:1245 start_codon:yes stop_codon:yes gene_type:complete
MKLSEWPGFSQLRFDTELKTFDGLMTLFLSSAERVKKSGKKVIAKGPLSPVDPIYAAGALAYDPYTHETIVHAIMKGNLNIINEAVDAGLSPDFNPWNLTMVGAVVSGKNEVPIDAYSTACGCWDDQIKKSWQIMAETTKSPSYFWEIPRFDAESEEWAVDFIVKELEHLFKWLTSQTGQKVTGRTIRDAIRRGNWLRQDLLELTQLLQSSPVPISALEYYIAQTLIGDYTLDPELLHQQYQLLLKELKERILLGELRERARYSTSTPEPTLQKPLRIFLMGEETQELQLFNIIEDHGGVLVGSDTRLPLYYEPIEEDGSAIENLARWLWKMPYNLPTMERIKTTIPYIKKQNPDTIIISSVVGSRNLPGAERLVKDIIRDELGIPVLSIETTRPLENIEKVDSQIRAFIEMNT